MTAGMPGEDPGWGKPRDFLIFVFPIFFVPFVGRRRMARQKSVLAVTRTLFLSFVATVLWFGVVLLLMDFGGPESEPPALSVRTAVIGVALIGLTSVTVSFRIGGPLVCGSQAELLGRYRVRLFLRIAFSEVASLVGFVATFVCEDPVAYFTGMALALVGFAGLAPTRRNLQREDEQLRATGCPTSLYEAMLLPMTPGSLSPGA